MSIDTHGIVVGIFKEETRAEDAIDELRNIGFSDDQLSFATQEGNELYRILNTLEHMGVSQEEVDYYMSEFNAGRSILLIRHEGRRVEALTVLFLNGTRSHKYLNEASNSTDAPTSAKRDLSKLMEASQSSSSNNQSKKFSRHDAETAEQNDDEIESLRSLLKSAGLDHLL